MRSTSPCGAPSPVCSLRITRPRARRCSSPPTAPAPGWPSGPAPPFRPGPSLGCSPNMSSSASVLMARALCPPFAVGGAVVQLAVDGAAQSSRFPSAAKATLYAQSCSAATVVGAWWTEGPVPCLLARTRPGRPPGLEPRRLLATRRSTRRLALSVERVTAPSVAAAIPRVIAPVIASSASPTTLARQGLWRRLRVTLWRPLRSWRELVWCGSAGRVPSPPRRGGAG